jgi:hypothetical protein
MNSIYSVIHIKIPEQHISIIQNDINNHFNDLCNKDELDSKTINEFFTKPHKLIEYHRYVYIGNYSILDAKLINIFKNIQESLNVSIENNAILQHIYDTEFVNKIISICNTSKINNEILHFIPYTILNDDNISSIYDILSLTIPNLTNDKIHLFADRTNIINESFYLDIKHKILQAATLFQNKTLKGKFNMDSLKFILWSFGVPFNTIQRIISTRYNLLNINESNDILQILNDPLIQEWIKIAFIYTTPSYQITHYNHELLYPIYSSPLLYLSSTNNPYYNDDITDVTKSFSVNKKGFKYTLLDVLSNQVDTLYIYSADDFKNIINDDNYKHTFLKLFPSLKRETVLLNKDVKDKYSVYNNISSSIASFNEELSSFVENTNNEPLYLELHHRIYHNTKIDLLNIFNNIVPNIMMPFIILRDSQIKEYIYKIYRPITEKKTNIDYDFPVSESELNKWINYTSYIVDGDIVKDIKDVVRGLQVKLLWKTAISSYIQKTGKIFEKYENIYNKSDNVSYYCSVIYNDMILRDIPFNSKFIKNYNDNLKKDDEITFYEPKKTYIDVSLDLNGHIYIKCPWKYINVYEDDTNNLSLILNQWINDMSNIFNEYIDDIYFTPILKQIQNIWLDKNPLSIDRFNIYSRYINGSTYIQQFDYRYMIKLPVDVVINYDKFIHILRLLKSVIVINEPVLNKNNKVEYYDIIKNTWETGFVISEYNIDSDSYIISKGAKIITDIKRNLLRIPAKRDIKDTEKINEINFTYKKVSDFNLLNTMQQFVLKLIQSNTPETEIVEQIMNEFDLNNERAYKEYFKYNNKDNENNVKILTYLKFDTGIDITIDYINSVSIKDDDSNKIGYNIFIKNVHSFTELSNITKLINYILHIYIYYENENYRNIINKPYITYIKEYLIKGTGIKEQELISDDKTQLIKDATFTMDQDDIDYDDLVDLDDAYQETQIMEEKEEIEEKKEEKKIVPEEKKSAKVSGRVSLIVKMLQKYDEDLFSWKTEKGEFYARSCQGQKQPVVLTNEEKNRIDPASYVVNDSIDCDMTNPESVEKIKKAGKDVRCAALKYGSSSKIENWYICPRIYDAYKRIPLKISDLKFEEPGFQQKDNLTGWRTDNTTGRDILTFGPSYQGRKPADSTQNITTEKSLIFKNSKFTPYPGFIDPIYIKNERGDIIQTINAPCCMFVHSDGVHSLFTGKVKEMRQHGEYILQWGKELDDGRYGYLNNYLNECFGQTKCITDKTKCIKRMGVRGGSQGFLYAISRIVGASNIQEFILKLLSNLNKNLFIRLNRGVLHNDFKTIGNISEFQNYIEYTLSNENKLIRHYYDLVTRPLGFSKCPNGFNLLIIEYQLNKKTNQYSYDIIVPYYTSFKKMDNINKLPTAVILKNRNYDLYEIIEFENMTLFQRGKLPNIDNMIDNIWELILRNQQPKYNRAPVNQKLKDALRINTVLMFEEAYNYITKNFTKYDCIYDGFQIIGIYIYDNKLFVPVYPTDFPDNLNICIQKILLEYLINNRNDMLLSFTDYEYSLKNLMNLLKKDIKFENIYKNDSNIIGVMTSYSVYVPLKDSIISNELLIKNNIFEIIKYMNETEILENRSIYVSPANYTDVINAINKFKNPIYKLVKKQNTYIGILLTNFASKLVNIYYPIKSIENIDNVTDFINIDELSIMMSIETYIKNANLLYNINKSIPIRPIRLFMDQDTKLFNGLLLETGDIIKFDSKYAIPSNQIQKLSNIVNDIVLNSLSDKLARLSLSRDKPLYIDDRITANFNISYQLDIYDYMIKTFNIFLKDIKNNEYRNAFINILYRSDLTIQQKLRIIRPLYIAIMKILFSINDSTNYEKCKTFNVMIPEVDTVEDYIYNIYFSNFNDIDTNITLQTKFNVNNKVELYNLYKNSSNDIEIETINYVLGIYKLLFNNYNNTDYCITQINNSIVNVNNMIDRLLNDFVKNRVIQDMIINEYSKIEYTDRYIQHEDEIIFRSGEGSKMWDTIKELYDKKLKLYYQNLVSLIDIQYDKELYLQMGETDRLKKNNLYKLKPQLQKVEPESTLPILEPPIRHSGFNEYDELIKQKELVKNNLVEFKNIIVNINELARKYVKDSDVEIVKYTKNIIIPLIKEWMNEYKVFKEQPEIKPQIIQQIRHSGFNEYDEIIKQKESVKDNLVEFKNVIVSINELARKFVKDMDKELVQYTKTVIIPLITEWMNEYKLLKLRKVEEEAIVEKQRKEEEERMNRERQERERMEEEERMNRERQERERKEEEERMNIERQERERMEEEERMNRELAEQQLYESMPLMDILKSYGMINKSCESRIFAALYTRMISTIDKNTLTEFKNAMDNNIIVNIELNKLKDGLQAIIERVLEHISCPKFNIIFEFYDNTYIHYPFNKITSDMINRKWLKIKIVSKDGALSFMKVNREYNYNEIEDLLRK